MMTDSRNAAAIRAEYTDYRRVKGRKVFQIFFEVPLEEASLVRERLGEPGVGGERIMAAIALLNPATGEPVNSADTSRERVNETGKSGHERKREPEGPFNQLPLVKQAGILCKDPMFQEFLQIDNASDAKAAEAIAARKVHNICRVDSRTELDQSSDARLKWESLMDGFRDWQRTDARYKDTPAYEKERATAKRDGGWEVDTEQWKQKQRPGL